MTDKPKWTEGMIAREIARRTLKNKCVVLVDRCRWTGHECDVLAVTTCLRIIDVEIKVTRSDLRADYDKDKWWHQQPWRYGQPRPAAVSRQWPPRVWKHYYAMPQSVWRDDLAATLVSAASGILVVADNPGQSLDVQCVRRARPNPHADRMTPNDVMDIARLANLRMWNAYEQLDVGRADVEHYRRQLHAVRSAA